MTFFSLLGLIRGLFSNTGGGAEGSVKWGSVVTFGIDAMPLIVTSIGRLVRIDDSKGIKKMTKKNSY